MPPDTAPESAPVPDPAASAAPAAKAPAPSIVRLLDVALVLMALPILLLLSAPALGVLVGSGVWILQRVLELQVAKIAKTKEDVRAAIGYNLGAMVGRAWLVGLSILAVGILGEREDGLAAALITFAAFTAYFATSLLASTFERTTSPS